LIEATTVGSTAWNHGTLIDLAVDIESKEDIDSILWHENSNKANEFDALSI